MNALPNHVMVNYGFVDVSDATCLMKTQNTPDRTWTIVMSHGIPNNIIDILQRVQNTAARIITRTSYSSHTTPVMIELYWLLMRYRIQNKIPLNTYCAANNYSPIYIMATLYLFRPSRTSISQNSLPLLTPRIRKTLILLQGCGMNFPAK